MDITALSSSMSLADVSSQVGIAVLAKNLDTIETLGDGMKKMMELSVNPNLPTLMFRFNKTGSGTKVLLYAIFIIAHGSTFFVYVFI